MAGLGIAIDLRSEAADRMLSGLELKLSSVGLSQFLATRIGPYLQQRAARRFRNEGDDASGAWLPLAETTWHWRISSGFVPDHPINERTGRLKEYILHAGMGVAPTGEASALLTFPKNGPSSPGLFQKLRTAQQGRGNPKTPARPVLAINSTDMVFMHGALEDFIRGAVGGQA